MPTLLLLAGVLRSFASCPALPLWYINFLLFTSTINIEYLVKIKQTSSLSFCVMLPLDKIDKIVPFFFPLNLLKCWNYGGRVKPPPPPPPHWSPKYSLDATALGGSLLLLTRFCWLPLKISWRLHIFVLWGLASHLLSDCSLTWRPVVKLIKINFCEFLRPTYGTRSLLWCMVLPRSYWKWEHFLNHTWILLQPTLTFLQSQTSYCGYVDSKYIFRWITTYSRCSWCELL